MRTLVLLLLLVGCRSTATEVTVHDPRAVHVMVDGREVAAKAGSETYDVPGKGTVTFERRPDGSVVAVAPLGEAKELVRSDGSLPRHEGAATETYMSKSALVRESLVLSTYSSYAGNVATVQVNYLELQMQTAWRNVRRVEERERRSLSTIVYTVGLGATGVLVGGLASRDRWFTRVSVLGGAFLLAVGALEIASPAEASVVEPTRDVTVEELRFARSDGNRVRAERTHRWGFVPAVFGLLGVAAGVTFGWLADDANERVAAQCATGSCDDTGWESAHERDRFRTWSGLAYVGGGALLSAGLATLFWKSTTHYGAVIVPAAEADRGGVQLAVRF